MRPRPIILFALAYGAGLATGLARFGDPIGVLSALLALAIWRRRELVGLCCMAGLCGYLAGIVAWEREAGRCPGALPPGRIELLVELREPVDSTGGSLQVRPQHARCTGAVDARWPRRHPQPAGWRATVVGRWIPRTGVLGRPEGVLVVEEVGRSSPGGGIAETLRTWLSGAIHSLYGVRAPVVEALVLNRRSTMDPEMRQRYAESGLVHLLSISGFHVGLLAGWIFFLGRMLGVGRIPALLSAATGSVAYVGLLGWPAPAGRAASVAVLMAVCQLRQRRVESNALLVVTGLAVVLLDPWALVDLSAWLSVAALWGATTFSRWSDRRVGAGFGWRTLAASLGATLATAPLTAAVLGTVSLAGILMNFVAIPIAALAVPGVLASVLLFPVAPSFAGALAAGAGVLLEGLDRLAGVGAAIPFAHALVPAEPASALPWVVALATALWGLGRRSTVSVALFRWSVGGAVAGWVGLLAWLSPLSRDNGSSLTLHFLSVGQGDAAVLRTPGGSWVVIDAGPKTDHDDAGRRVVVPFLARQGARRVSALVVSHPHADHLGGAADVVERFPTDVVLEPGELIADRMYLDFLGAVAVTGASWKAGRRGDRFELDGVRFTLLHPDTAWAEWGQDLNEDSIVLLVQYRDFQALFPGDAGFHAESLLAGGVGHLDLLKVGHHGSRTATGDRWLEELRPRVAVISVGAVNRFGHPAPTTLDRLIAHGVSVWRTDREGEVAISTDGETMTVRGRRGTETFSVQ